MYEIASAHRLITHTVEGDVNSPTVKTTAYVDYAGRMAKQGYFIGTTEYIDNYTYDYVGNKLKVKTAQTTKAWNSYDYTNQWEYDYAGRVTKEHDIYGKYSSFEYNALGRLAYSKDPKANNTSGSLSTEYIYDALGRLIKQTTPFEGTSVSTVKYYYDNNGNVTEEQTSSNAIGANAQWTKVAYEYNNRNMLTKTTNYDLGVAASYVQYYYDAVGNPLRMYTGHSVALTINGLDNVAGTVQSVTKYEYDRFGNLTKLTDPMGYVETSGYDLLGRMLTKTDRNGKIFTYAYDGLGRLLNTKNGSTTLETYTYTLTGNKRTESNSVGTLTYAYDSLGRLTDVSEPNNVTKKYTYDIGSNRETSKIYIGSTLTNDTSYTYDEASRMKTVSESGVLQCTYNYDVNGNRAKLTYNASGVTTDYTYNLANLVKTLSNKKGTTVLSSYSYTYRLDGNQVSKTDHTGKVTSYVYDGLGRLKSESSPGNTITYDIDASSNRKKMTVNGTVTTYDYDKNNRLKTETTGATVTTYTYDNNGSTLTKKIGTTTTETYGYDLLNRMISSIVSGVSATYIYRPDGLRYSKTSGGIATIHIWDGSNIVGDVANGVVSATYVRGIGLIASKIGGAFTYYMYNGHGDVVQLINSSGTAITKSYDYDAFGVEKGQTLYGDVNGDGKINSTDAMIVIQYANGENISINLKAADVDLDGVITATDAMLILGCANGENSLPVDSNPFRYCGEYFDSSSGTYYLRARYYNPKVGRFTQQDNVCSLSRMKPNGKLLVDPLSLNYYTYAHNNPVKYIDPSGRVVTSWDRENLSKKEQKKIQEYTDIWHDLKSTQDQKTAAALAAASIRAPYLKKQPGAVQLSNGYVKVTTSQTMNTSVAGGNIEIKTNIVFTQLYTEEKKAQITLNSVSSKIDYIASNQAHITGVNYMYGVTQNPVFVENSSARFSVNANLPYVWDSKMDMTIVGLYVTYNYENRGSTGTVTIVNQVYSQYVEVNGKLYDEADFFDVLIEAFGRGERQ